MAKEYQPSVIVTSDGRVITGIVRQQDGDALSVQTANELITLPRGEIDQMAAQPTIDDARRPAQDTLGRRMSARWWPIWPAPRKCRCWPRPTT